MLEYIPGVILLYFLVNFLLLLGAGRLCGEPTKWAKAVMAATIGGIYAGACLLPGFYFLGNLLWRCVSLLLMSMIAYGLSADALRKGLIFGILSFALGGAVLGIGKGGPAEMLGTAGILCIICGFGLRDKLLGKRYIPVELTYQGKNLQLTALRDTGNGLIDPVTGRQVLVVGADVAQKLTGLTREQLHKPVESMGSIPGLRLIPYRSINCSSGFLLGMRFQDVKIGSWQGSSLVAFAPEWLHPEGAYQALTGGAV